MLGLWGGKLQWHRDNPSPPQALPTAFEAEKRSDGRSVTGSCLGTPPSINRAIPYLFARDPSTKVVVSVSRDGSHYRAIGKGATLEMKLVLAMLHKPWLSDREPWSCLRTGREGAGHRPPAFRRGGTLLSVWADLSSFPRGKHLWDSPGYSWSPQVSLSSITLQGYRLQCLGRPAEASRHFASSSCSTPAQGPVRAEHSSRCPELLQAQGSGGGSKGEERGSPAASDSQYLWSIPFYRLRDFELPPEGKENTVRMSPSGTSLVTTSSRD